MNGGSGGRLSAIWDSRKLVIQYNVWNMVSRTGRESWTGDAKASEIRADSIVELTAEPPGTLPERSENDSMGTRKSVLQHWRDHCKHQEAGHAQKVHSGASPNVD
jgi:hypothetical protein